MAEQDDFYPYHYTTVDAFISIVRNKELWASNILYLNDTAEFHLAVTLTRELLKAEIRDESTVVYRQKLEKVSKSLEEIEPETTAMLSSFVCSFSKKEDDLSQWRAYCQKGGVAVGFRRGDLDYLTQNQGLGFAPELVRCVYEEEEQRRLIRSCVDEAVKTAHSGVTGQSMSDQEISQYKAILLETVARSQQQMAVTTDCTRSYISIVSPRMTGWTSPVMLCRYEACQTARFPPSVNRLCSLFSATMLQSLLLQGILMRKPIKHKAFVAEEEWRLIASPDSGMTEDSRLGFRSHNGLVIPFWKIKLAPEGDKRIWGNVRVTVGPSPHPHQLKAAIEGVLKRYCGHGGAAPIGEVRNSDVPFRYW